LVYDVSNFTLKEAQKSISSLSTYAMALEPNTLRYDYNP